MTPQEAKALPVQDLEMIRKKILTLASRTPVDRTTWFLEIPLCMWMTCTPDVIFSAVANLPLGSPVTNSAAYRAAKSGWQRMRQSR